MKNLFLTISILLSLNCSAQRKSIIFKLSNLDTIVYGFKGENGDSLFNLLRYKNGIQQHYANGQYEIYASNRFKNKIHSCEVIDSIFTNEIYWNKKGIKIAEKYYWPNGKTKTYCRWFNSGLPLLVEKLSSSGVLILNKEFEKDGSFKVSYYRKEHNSSKGEYAEVPMLISYFDPEGFMIDCSIPQISVEEDPIQRTITLKISDSSVFTK